MILIVSDLVLVNIERRVGCAAYIFELEGHDLRHSEDLDHGFEVVCALQLNRMYPDIYFEPGVSA